MSSGVARLRHASRASAITYCGSVCQQARCAHERDAGRRAHSWLSPPSFRNSQSRSSGLD